MDNIVQRWNENAPYSSHEVGRVIHALVCLLTKTGLSFTTLSRCHSKNPKKGFKKNLYLNLFKYLFHIFSIYREKVVYASRRSSVYVFESKYEISDYVNET